MPVKLPDAAYNWIKWLLIIVVPAFGTLYSQVADPLGLGGVETVLRVLFAVAAFLGLILGVSTVQYNNSDDKYDGTIDPLTANMQTSDKALDLSTDEYDAANQKEVLLKVKVDPNSV